MHQLNMPETNTNERATHVESVANYLAFSIMCIVMARKLLARLPWPLRHRHALLIVPVNTNAHNAHQLPTLLKR